MAESVSHWASRSGPIAAVRGLEATGGRLGAQSAIQYWSALAELGVFGIAVPEQAGGAGGSVADLAAVVEQLAAWLVPGPVLPTLLAGLLLAGLGPAGHLPADPGRSDPPSADFLAALLADLAAGGASVAVALSPGSLSAAALADGSLRVTGRCDLVLGAGDTTHLLLGARTDSGERWFVLGADDPGLHVSSRTPVDFSRALADVRLDDALASPGQQLNGLCTGQVRDAAATLGAAEAAGVAAWCSRTAAEYAATRRQFGRPIGSFQAVKHLCAGMLCRAELAAAAAWDAACAAGQASHPLAAAAAAALALDAAVDNAKDCVQVLGGIGFTWEHDAHLYLRRALALRQLLGGSAGWRARAAELALAGMRRDSDPRLRINETSGAGAVRSAARSEAARIAALPPDARRMALAQSGYAAPHWPAPYGRSADPVAQLVIDEELASAGLTQPDLSIGGWAVPAILGYGTRGQQDRFAGPTLRGEIAWCQLFSEPEAGSDLASLRTRAVRVDGGWLLTGQKVWTSLAKAADWAICLARTDSAATKHRGISFFLVVMNSPGIDIRPLREMTGREMFNEVFLDDVFVPEDCLVGAPGDGWRIARATLATERVAMGRGSALSAEVQELLAVANAVGGQDAIARDQLGARLAEGLALAAMDDRLASAVLGGAEPGFASAVRKLLGVEHRQALAETALTLGGTDGAATDGAAAEVVHQFLMTRCLSIAGGTSQILLSLVAERLLGLPREEAR
jgi:alkylation response protein AidB-like acyl-CoA dehydrogenase